MLIVKVRRKQKLLRKWLGDMNFRDGKVPRLQLQLKVLVDGQIAVITRAFPSYGGHRFSMSTYGVLPIPFGLDIAGTVPCVYVSLHC